MARAFCYADTCPGLPAGGMAYSGFVSKAVKKTRNCLIFYTDFYDKNKSKGYVSWRFSL